MIGLAVLTILAAMATPSFNDLRKRTVLKGAVEQYSGALSETKNEAIKENTEKTVDFNAITESLPSEIKVVSGQL